jgi:hypothetical protein
VQQLTGDYAAATASQQQALALCRDTGHVRGQTFAVANLAIVQRLTGDYAAAASGQQALAMFRQLGNEYGQALALANLGAVQQLTGD